MRDGRVSADVKRRALEMYLDPESPLRVVEICEELGVSDSSVYRWLNEGGVKQRRVKPEPNEARWVKALAMAEKGLSLTRISSECHLCDTTLRRLLHGAGIPTFEPNQPHRPWGRKRKRPAVRSVRPDTRNPTPHPFGVRWRQEREAMLSSPARNLP